MQEQYSIVITHTFSQPKEQVWDAWITPEKIPMWWGPRGVTTKVIQLDFKLGGLWMFVMVDKDGVEYPREGVYAEISEHEKLVITEDFGSEYRKQYPELPKGIVTTVLFKDVQDGSMLTIQINHSTQEDEQKHEQMGVAENWNSSLERLSDYLSLK